MGDQVKARAERVIAEHGESVDAVPGYCHRCLLRHPCDFYELARDVLGLLEAMGRWVNAQPAQMSWNGGLINIDSDGMRQVIDENARLRKALPVICSVCRTQKAGLPTPGYIHDEGCPLRTVDAAFPGSR